MKQKLLLALFALLTATMTWADVEINETNFPDENFRAWLFEQDYGADGKLTDEEIAGITYMQVKSRNIISLKGIEYFTALTSLNCELNKLTTLDVSKNTALGKLFCNSNQLTALDVSKNTNLDVLRCYSNQMTELDMSGCSLLRNLQCFNNQLTALDLSGKPALRTLECYKNMIKDAAMDALVESLPIVSDGSMSVIYRQSDLNVMTTAQVAAAKAKGWTPLWMDLNGKWVEYAGSEPSNPTGDLNGDFKIDIADAVSILNLMAEGADNPSADLNNDGKVDIADFVSVLNLMAGQ